MALPALSVVLAPPETGARRCRCRGVTSLACVCFLSRVVGSDRFSTEEWKCIAHCFYVCFGIVSLLTGPNPRAKPVSAMSIHRVDAEQIATAEAAVRMLDAQATELRARAEEPTATPIEKAMLPDQLEHVAQQRRVLEAQLANMRRQLAAQERSTSGRRSWWRTAFGVFG